VAWDGTLPDHPREHFLVGCFADWQVIAISKPASAPATPLSRESVLRDRRLCVPASRRVCEQPARNIAFDLDNKQLYECRDRHAEMRQKLLSAVLHALRELAARLGYHHSLPRDFVPDEF
jgi:hypothetical protein